MSEKFCERPWGTWEVIDQGPWYKVKRLTVNQTSLSHYNITYIGVRLGPSLKVAVKCD